MKCKYVKKIINQGYVCKEVCNKEPLKNGYCSTHQWIQGWVKTHKETTRIEIEESLNQPRTIKIKTKGKGYCFRCQKKCVGYLCQKCRGTSNRRRKKVEF